VKKKVSSVMVILLLSLTVLLSGCNLYKADKDEDNGEDTKAQGENLQEADNNPDNANGAEDSNLDNGEEDPSKVDEKPNSDTDNSKDNSGQGSSDSNSDKESSSGSVDKPADDKGSGTKETGKENNGSKTNSYWSSMTQAQRTARTLNTEGYNLYKAANYEEALKKFKTSMETDETYFFGHFNYACTLGVLMQEDYPEWYEYKDEVIDVLSQCLIIDPSSKEKIMNDSDLKPVRSHMRYLTEIAGYSLKTPEGIEAILQQANWYRQGQGAMPVIGGINFDEDNHVTLWKYNINEFFSGEELKQIEYTGTYKVNGTTIQFQLDTSVPYSELVDSGDEKTENPSEIKEFSGTLSEEGVLQIDIFDYPIYSWYDEFSA